MHIASFQVLVVLTRPKIAFGVPIKDYQNGSLTGAIRVIYARFYELGSVGGGGVGGGGYGFRLRAYGEVVSTSGGWPDRQGPDGHGGSITYLFRYSKSARLRIATVAFRTYLGRAIDEAGNCEFEALQRDLVPKKWFKFEEPWL